MACSQIQGSNGTTTILDDLQQWDSHWFSSQEEIEPTIPTQTHTCLKLKCDTCSLSNGPLRVEFHGYVRTANQNRNLAHCLQTRY